MSDWYSPIPEIEITYLRETLPICTIGGTDKEVVTSVTRFGEISPLWHNLKTFGPF